MAERTGPKLMLAKERAVLGLRGHWPPPCMAGDLLKPQCWALQVGTVYGGG